VVETGAAGVVCDLLEDLGLVVRLRR